MRILLLGSGGREHALALALVRDPAVTGLVCAPGNPGMASVAHVRDADLADLDAIASLAVELNTDLVIVGPEAPLVAGAADVIRAKGIAVFGPSRAAARLEGSKDFAKSVMAAAGVPTGRSYTCETHSQVAAALDEFGAPYVVKDDALAAGKGVVVTDDRAAALAHAATRARVVIEEYLAGPEVSLLVITDGETAMPMLPAQDFKRIGDGDSGPNTGGMGAYAPLPWLPEGLVDDVMTTVVEPTLAEMRHRGAPFAGVLYVGLAITPEGPKVIEFNCRFGDPETQVVLPLLGTPLARILQAAATGTLAGYPALRWKPNSAVTVVVASSGYPESARTGDVIKGAEVPGVIHAGTGRNAAGELVSAGGRVLCCTGVAPTLAGARDAAYALVDGIRLDGSQHRTDIAAAAIDGLIELS